MAEESIHDTATEPEAGRPRLSRLLLAVEKSDRFEAAFRGGESPRIEDYLDGTAGPDRLMLLRELLALELELQRKNGLEPGPRSYLERFPVESQLVDEVFQTVNRPEGSMPSIARINDRATVATTFDEVGRLCEDFTSSWTPDARPRIESYLDRVEPDARETLLRNLLAIEIRGRRAAGERPEVDDYRGRFPDHFTALVRESFVESSFALNNQDRGADKSSARGSRLVADRLGEYQLVRELGRGGMGVVYEARHLRQGIRVALKVLPMVDGTTLHRFKREFRALSGTNHPNLVGLLTLESDGCHWFFTMDLLEGEDFLTYVRPGGELNEGRLRDSLAQLAAGVMALHGRGIVHRDLKPSNVMVARDGRVVLLDFGLVFEMDRESVTDAGQIAGTPCYMAPEQVEGLDAAAASDWYSVGVMVYEALLGTPPYAGRVFQILRDKQRFDPAPIPRNAGLPDDLAELGDRLLARNPKDRPDAFEVAKRVSFRASTPLRGPNAAGSLVGRERHLGALNDAYQAVERRGEPQIVFIEGRSGEGKSTLSEHFLRQLREKRAPAVMTGRCYDRESVPFKALDSLIDSLTGYLRALPETEAALLMPDDIGLLARVFPVLRRVDVVARGSADPPPSLDERQLRERAFGALRSLLGRISRRFPIVWFIDDLQWGDADSAEALFKVLRPPEAPRVLFLGAYRSDETDASTFLQMWEEQQRLQGVRFAEHKVGVGPLTAEECAELVVNLLNRDDEVIRRRAVEFAKEAQGNPFLLIELVGCFDPDTDSFEAAPLHEVLTRKLGRLPEAASLLLDVVAVSGHALMLEEASRTIGHVLPPVETVARMRNERLIRMIGPDESPLIDTYHDRVRETVLSRMVTDSRKSIHRMLAEVIEQGTGVVAPERVEDLGGGEGSEEFEPNAIPRVFDLAYHYDAAGVERKACVYSLLAAEEARRQSALEVAATNYATAQRNAGEAGEAVRRRIGEGYGEALMLLGRYDEANRQLLETIEQVADDDGKARIETVLGENSIKQGNLGACINYYERALRRLGHAVPRTSIGYVAGLVREVVIQCVHSWLPRRLHRTPIDGRSELVIRLFYRLSHPLTFQNTLKMLWAHLAGMNRAEKSPPSPGLAYIYAFHNTMMAITGWITRGDRYGDRAITLVSEFDDTWVLGQCRNYRGIGLFASARFEEGVSRLTEAVAAYEKAGDVWEVHLAHFHKGCCHFGLGNLAEAVAEARWTFDSSARLGDSRTMCSSWLWARAARGDIPFEEMRSCIPNRPDDVMSTVHGTLAEGYWHTFHGRTVEALRCYEAATSLVRESFCVNSHTILAVPMLAMGLRLRAEAAEPTDAQLGKALRKRAARVAAWAARWTRLCPAAYPFALRERALVLADLGRLRTALKFADKSRAVADSQNAKYEHAQSLLTRGRIARRLGLPEADEQIREAERALDVIESPLRDLGAPSRTPPGHRDADENT